MIQNTTPLQPDVPSRADAKRLLDLVVEGMTDRSETPLRVPLDEYGAARWKRECDEIFKVVPLGVAFSFDMREPYSYIALDILDVPVLLTRGSDGKARAFVNVCTHRGVCIMDEGTGTSRRFTCPYHAWSFDNEGRLAGLPSERKFGEVDRSHYGLTELPCDERHGVIWISLTPGSPLDVDDWLGEAGPILESFHLDECHPFATAVVPGGNWKAVMDGYLETYHFPTLHPGTRNYYYADLFAVDKVGRHVHAFFAANNVEDMLAQDEADWDVERVISRNLYIFPNLSIGINFPTPDMPGMQFASFTIYPDQSWDRSQTRVSIFTSKPAETEQQKADVAARVEETVRVIRDEDYPMVERQMRGWRSGALTHNTYGRNEHINQIWLHDGLKAMLG